MAGNSHNHQILASIDPATLGILEPLIRFEVTTEAGRILSPVRGCSMGVETVRALLAGRVNPDLPFLTFRERGATVLLTLRDMKLAP